MTSIFGPAARRRFMKSSIVFEDIEELRRREGIVDTALNSDIARLKPGSRVRLSLATDRNGFETVTVCITSNRPGALRGRLVKKPKAAALKGLDIGSLLTFQTGHIHSIIGRNNAA